jgi:hypothetical protein
MENPTCRNPDLGSFPFGEDFFLLKRGFAHVEQRDVC